MEKISTGDTVRFLNTTGGGIVKGFRNKQVVIVEDEHGFDVPVLISECVVIKPAGSVIEAKIEKPVQFPEETAASRNVSHTVSRMPSTAEEKGNQTEETPEGEKITVCLAWLPSDIKKLSSSACECYFVNDSNYHLFFTYMSRNGDSLTIRHSGFVEPNTKIFLEEIEKGDLEEIEKITVQFIAFKRNKPFTRKKPCTVDLRIDTVKFHKLHSFRENDYFEEDALLYYIMRNDIPEDVRRVSVANQEQAIKEKELHNERPRRERAGGREKKEAVTEIDLHVGALLDTTAGMKSADILEYQLLMFNKVMGEHLHRKNHKIVFIHGKGDGVLRSAVVNELKKKYPKCFYQDASFREYGFGATMVTIK